MSTHHRGAAVVVLAIVGVVGASRALRADAPGQISFQARLTNATGTPLPDGTVPTVAFQIFSDQSAAAASFLWGEAQTNVPISRGIISVRLGNGSQAIDANFNVTAQGPNPIPAGIFDGYVKYVQIRVNTDPPLSPLVPLVSVPYALSAGSLNGLTSGQMVPVGTIVDWFPPTPGASPPTGWMVCDGSTVSDSASPYNGKAVPDLRQKVTRGINPALASTLGPGSLPDIGGQNATPLNLAHSHNVAAHNHSLPDHTHTYSGVTGPPTVVMPVFNSGIVFDLTGDENHAHDYSGTTATETYVAGSTGPNTGMGGGGPTDTQLGTYNISTVPAYVGLLKIIRIK